MCVAIHVPAGTKTPSLETLQRCWTSNPDGAGIAWRTPGEKYCIRIEKGFMTWLEFENYWKKMDFENFKEDMLIHFRIATHGGVCAGNTHPFPLIDDVKWLQSTSLKCNTALIHNGVLDCTPEDKRISDSMELCRLIARNAFVAQIDKVFNLLEPFTYGSKLCALTSSGVYRTGTWYEHEGVFYSNEYWMPGKSRYYSNISSTAYTGKTSSTRMYSGWDDETYEVACTKVMMTDLVEGKCPYCRGFIDEYEDSYVCYECGVSFIKNEVSKQCVADVKGTTKKEKSAKIKWRNWCKKKYKL